VQVTVFLQAGLFLLHLLGETETNGAGTMSGFLVTVMCFFVVLRFP
jgi:hypothetical protein